MNTELNKLIHAMILDSHMPAKVIAKQIGKPYSTLLREVNPYDGGAKLGVETFLEIIKLTGDTACIEYMVEELGYEMRPKSMRKTG
ncbi:amino acid-binding protein [Desulfovibrio sp. OttesenSCG-928-A18]|nr:amino acid-binding protein [Desulfovibrio sp. OttesenSCG-928-A18]